MIEKWFALFDFTTGAQAMPGGGTDALTIVKNILTAAFVVVGVLGVVAVVYGGVQYIISHGDPGKVKNAKDALLYGIIGIFVALAAFAITQFVINALK